MLLQRFMKFDDEKECDNCNTFAWKQPDDKSIIKRCSKCQLFWYCSDQCQKEHWHNAHKHHCKYLAEKKVLANAKHNDDTCLVCKEETKAGKKNISKSSNPVLPCYMSTTNQKFMNVPKNIGEDGTPQCDYMLAKPLAEMTGVYLSKVDETFAIMLRILVKMKKIKHIVWSSTRKPSTEEMFSILGVVRENEWWCQMNTKPGSNEHNGVAFDEYESVEFIDALKDVDDTLVSPTPDLLWVTFKILFSFSYGSMNVAGSLFADYLGASESGMPNEIEKIRMPHAKFHQLWEDVLDRMKEGLVPMSTLVDALCEGDPERQCYECGVQVTVQAIVVLHGSYHHYPGIPVLMFGTGLVFSLCGKDSCFQSYLTGPFQEARRQMLAVNRKLQWEYGGEFCDYCGGIGQEVKSHRCAKCKTKVYCSVECLNKDKVHLMLCKEGEMRKMKPSSGSRREEGKMALEKQLLKGAPLIAREGWQ